MSDNTAPQQAETPATSTELELYMPWLRQPSADTVQLKVSAAIEYLRLINTMLNGHEYDTYELSGMADVAELSGTVNQHGLLKPFRHLAEPSSGPYYDLCAGYGAMTSLLGTLPEGIITNAYGQPLERLALSIARTVDDPSEGMFDRLDAHRRAVRETDGVTLGRGKSVVLDMLRRSGAFSRFNVDPDIFSARRITPTVNIEKLGDESTDWKE